MGKKCLTSRSDPTAMATATLTALPTPATVAPWRHTVATALPTATAPGLVLVHQQLKQPGTATVILILPPTAPPTHLPRTPATATVTHILQPTAPHTAPPTAAVTAMATATPAHTPPHTAEDTATATPTAQPTAPPTATVILMAPPTATALATVTATPMATAARHSAFTVGSAASS